MARRLCFNFFLFLRTITVIITLPKRCIYYERVFKLKIEFQLIWNGKEKQKPEHKL